MTGSWDDDDDTDSSDDSVLDHLADFSPIRGADDSDDLWEPPIASASESDDVETLIVTAANPSDSVGVTALISGRVLNVDLAPSVTTMTEAELAEEITIIATTARKQAQAAQHGIIAQYMAYLGNDPISTRSFLEYDLGLPSPQRVLEDKAELFASRYAADEQFK